MEMEDHNHHNQYNNIDLRQFITGRPTHHFPPIPHPPDLFSGHRNLQPPPLPHANHPYDMMMLMPRGGGGGGLHGFHNDSNTPAVTCVPSPAAAAGISSANTGSTTAVANVSATLSSLEAEAGCSFGGDGGTGRWPRQETLTLLEIRSRLDSKFKEANQKGPLWDEVSRIMSEEHGYQRSGKKCREKFENLYKYYKKTKEGKAGRQDGKHYRFFRQLEALYGETSNPASIADTQFVGNSSLRFHNAANNISSQAASQETTYHTQKLCDSLSLSNSTEFETTSSEDNDLSTATLVENDSTEKRRKKRDGKSWKAKIKEFIDSQMRNLIERQESWLEKLTKTLEQKEQERMIREEEWRKQESARIDREHKFWAKERAWIEARDAALMEALQKLTENNDRVDIASSPEGLIMGTNETRNQISENNLNENGSDKTIHNNVNSDQSWSETEVTRLMQLRSSMESRFNQCGCTEEEEGLWEEIAAKMACIGYETSSLMCKDKWVSINNYMRKIKDGNNKKRKENSRGSCYNFQNSDHDQSVYNPGSGSNYCEINHEHGQEGSSPISNPNINVASAVSDSCFRFLMSDGEHLWENYGLKLSKGDQNN